MTSVGWATLSVIPSMRGFQSALDKGTSPALAAAGASGGRRYSNAFARALKFGVAGGGIGAAFGVASFIKDSVELEARYGKTMAQMRVATQAPADELQRLDDLAVSLGKETVFSAVEASDAMLELAKNGIKPATIEAGALESALTLAAAGSVDLTDSATVMGNTLNAFRLRGNRAASVAAALAGAANASSASVGSLAEGLQQASTVAADTGFNVQETTGVLAAFANAGVEGSDAGTSLKTMLSRLLPTTAKAKDYMDRYGLSFVKANGEFKSATEIAGNLKAGLEDLSASERSQALNVIFGSDARRAATILTKEGAEGIRDYIKATSDQGAAEEMAQANMEGTAGAIERLKGSWETTKLEFGKSIAPVAADFLDYLSTKVDDVAPKLVQFGEWFTEDGVPKVKAFAAFVRDDALPVIKDIGDFAGDAAGLIRDLSGAFGKLPDTAKLAAIAAIVSGGTALKVRGGGGGALGGTGRALGLAKPVNVFVTNPGFGANGGGGGGAGPDGKPRRGPSNLGGAAALLPFIPVLDEALKGNMFTEGADELGRKTNEFFAGLIDAIPDTKRDPSVVPDVFNRLPQNDINGNDLDAVRTTVLEQKLDGINSKAGKFGETLDLVGNKKVDPSLTIRGMEKAQRDLQDFLAAQIEARNPITPYVVLTGIDRAEAQIDALIAKIHTIPNAGVDNGVPYVGGTGIVNNFNGPINATDVKDITRKANEKARQRGLGGRP